MLVPLALLAALAPASAAPAPPAAPHFAGETTDGTSVRLPDAAHGKTLIVVVGMSQGSADATERWSKTLAAEDGARATVYGVALLDSVPGFARAWVKHSLAKRIGPPQPGKGFLMTFEGRELRAAAPAGNPDDPVIYVYRPDGSLATAVRRAYDGDAAAFARNLL